MSIEGYHSLLSNVQDFKLKPIATATDTVLNELEPLLVGDGSLEKHADVLKQIVQMVVKAVTYNWAMCVYFSLGLHSICDCLERWPGDSDEVTASVTISTFVWLTKKLRYAKANAMDAKEQYEAAKRDAEPLFRQYLEEFGPDKVVQLVTKQKYDDHLNFQTVPLKAIAENVISKLEQCIDFTGQCIRMLQEIDAILVSFLEDEALSAGQPLNTIPIWSKYSYEVWGVLYGSVEGSEFQFKHVMRNHSRLFGWIPDSESGMQRLEEDEKEREAYVFAPEVKLHIPEDPEKYPLPLDILESPIGNAGDAILKVASVEYVTDKISRMEFSIALPSAIPSGLDNVSLICYPDDDDSPGVRFMALNSSGMLDSPASKRKFGFNRAPRLKTSFTQTRSEFKVERRFLGSIPTQFSVLLDAEYGGSCVLRFEFCFILDDVHCCDRSIPIRIPEAKNKQDSVRAK
ncbi:hypothetical protein CVT24_006828 [Panaeolus cyanescens]|uniref:Uncharacterized protein n=1 Tax=Panaeolus cyanescens TaxID=181874 RepID=A0A409YRY3_9AGAR|nr:hypothetical protein CVT24_006828 [Panaeolus cyanescens]